MSTSGKSATTISMFGTIVSLWRSFVISIGIQWNAAYARARKIGCGAAFVNTQPAARDAWKSSPSGRQESASARQGHFVRLPNYPTQAKRWLEWGTHLRQLRLSGSLPDHFPYQTSQRLSGGRTMAASALQ